MGVALDEGLAAGTAEGRCGHGSVVAAAETGATALADICSGVGAAHL